MASQYITFMIIFTLGLSMVIITNGMFTTLSEQFRENVADLELNEILEHLRLQIQQNAFFNTEENQIIMHQIELPSSLGQGFRYSIQLSNSSDGRSVIISAYTLNNQIFHEINFSVDSNSLVKSSGEFTSTDSYLNLRYERKNSQIIITVS